MRTTRAACFTRGYRVATYGYARPEYFVTFLATASIGAIWLGLSLKYTVDELEHNVRDARPRLIFALLPPATSRPFSRR